MGPLSRKACVKQWKSNGKIAVSMCDHYGVEAQKKNMEETSKTVYTVQLYVYILICTLCTLKHIPPYLHYHV